MRQIDSNINALIVCHAGTGLGLGHLTRSLVVARSINQELGIKVKVLIHGDRVQRADLVEFDHEFLGIDEELTDAILKDVEQDDIQIIVFDLQPKLIPDGMESFLKLLHLRGCKTIGIDSLASYHRTLDLVFIPSLLLPPLERITNKDNIRFGWDCFLLNVKSPSNDWKHGLQVLVLTGGSDATSLGETLPTLLNDTLSDNIDLHWVTGPYAKQPVKPTQSRLVMINHQSPSSLDNLMLEANYAVTVYGVSFFELLYYGVPTVVFSPYGNKDEEELNAIEAEGIALVASDEVDAVRKLKQLMGNDKLAASLSKRAKQKMFVSGGQTFAHAVSELMVNI